jgi:hypothetical protein
MEQEPLIPGFGESIQQSQKEQGADVKPPAKNNRTGTIIAIIALAFALGAMYIWQNKKPEVNEQNNRPVIGADIDKSENTKGEEQPVVNETGLETKKEGVYFVYFSKGGEDCSRVYPLERKLIADEESISTALINLFFGPTAAEKEAGYNSFFSKETDYILHSVKVRQGVAYVDIKDIRNIMPNASSSCGSAQLLAQIRETLQQFPEINDFRVAIDSEPELFYEWLQIGCQEDLCDRTNFLSGANGDSGAKSELCEDKCGDGVCQEIVCLGSSCPCAETASSCPLDCK